MVTKSIDAGQSFSFRSRTASFSLTAKAPGVYGEITAGGDRGLYTLDVPGGRDVPPFRVTFPMQELVWTNELAASTVTRAEGLTITWSAPNASQVLVTLDSNIMIPAASQRVVCSARAADGQITIPASVLSRFPASPLFAAGTANPNRMPGSIKVNGLTYYRAKPPGLDAFDVVVLSGPTRFVVFR